MSDTKRYDCDLIACARDEQRAVMEESPYGGYVRVEDYDALAARLAEAEALLSACYSPVRRIAEGGSRTREDLDLAAETFAALKRYLKPVAVPADSAPAVTGNCGLCGQPRADHAEVAPDGKPCCRMKSGNAGNIVKHAVSADVNYADETRQFNEYAARKAREDRERESGHEECPKCQSHNTHAGYGLAAGGIGCYTICMDCGHVLSSVQDVF